MNAAKMRLKWLDIAMPIVFTAAIVFSILAAKRNKGSILQLQVQGPSAKYIYPLNRNGEYKVPGLLGNSIIVINDGKAFFKDSPCPNKTCVHTGTINRNGDWAACLPNDVFIRISGTDDKELDAIAQ